VNLPRKPDLAVRAVMALFMAAIAAGYSAADLWQVAVAAAMLAGVLTWLSRQ
jgi:hypothetical protein